MDKKLEKDFEVAVAKLGKLSEEQESILDSLLIKLRDKNIDLVVKEVINYITSLAFCLEYSKLAGVSVLDACAENRLTLPKSCICQGQAFTMRRELQGIFLSFTGETDIYWIDKDYVPVGNMKCRCIIKSKAKESLDNIVTSYLFGNLTEAEDIDLLQWCLQWYTDGVIFEIGGIYNSEHSSNYPDEAKMMRDNYQYIKANEELIKLRLTKLKEDNKYVSMKNCMSCYEKYFDFEYLRMIHFWWYDDFIGSIPCNW